MSAGKPQLEPRCVQEQKNFPNSAGSEIWIYQCSVRIHLLISQLLDRSHLLSEELPYRNLSILESWERLLQYDLVHILPTKLL